MKTYSISLIILSVLACVMPSCEGPKHNITFHFDADTVEFVRILPVEIQAIDTFVITAENRNVMLNIEESSYVGISIKKDNKTISCFLHPNDKIEIFEDGDTYDIKGSKETDEIENMLDYQIAFIDSIKILEEYAQKTYHPNYDSLVEISNTYYHVYRKQLQQFFEEHPKSPANIFSLFQIAGQRPLFDIYRDKSMFEKIATNLEQEYPSLKEHTDYIREGLSKTTLPDFAHPDREGNMIDVKEHIAGSWALISFWSERYKETTDLFPLWKSMKQEHADLKVVLINLDGFPDQDNPKKIWEDAIASHKVEDFIHLGDLQSTQSPVVQLFSIQNLPLTFLVDPEGEIRAHNLPNAEWPSYLQSIKE